MILRPKLLFFLLPLLLMVYLFGQAQDLNLKPPQTKLVNVSKDAQEEIVMTTYKYKSRHSKPGILKFYRKMFNNQGFSEVQGSPPKKDVYKLNYFFKNQSQGATIILNFLRLVDEGEITYYITTHHFSLKPEKEYLQSEPES